MSRIASQSPQFLNPPEPPCFWESRSERQDHRPRQIMFSIPVVGIHCHGIFETVHLRKIQAAWAVTVERDSVCIYPSIHTHYILSIHREFNVRIILQNTSYRYNSICDDRTLHEKRIYFSLSLQFWNSLIQATRSTPVEGRGWMIMKVLIINSYNWLIVFCVLGTVLWAFHVDLI